MDTLALLCNLHADGPATLAKLRASGCRTLAELDQMPQRALAHALGGNGERARRFLREARLLGGRVDSTPREHAAGAHEESVHERDARAASATASPRESASQRGSKSQSSATPVHDDVGGPFAAPARAADPFAVDAFAAAQTARRERYAMQPLKDAVLRVWSEQDRLDPPHAIVRATSEPLRSSGATDGLAGLDGCDASARNALAAAGVTSAEEFLARDTLELAAKTGLAFSALNRWRFLLRREAPARSPRRR